MEKKLLKILKKINSNQNLVLLVILSILMSYVILPEAESTVSEISGGVGIFKEIWVKTPHEIYEQTEKLGLEGRKRYAFMLSTAQVVFALINAVFFSLILMRISKTLTFDYKNQLILLPFLIAVVELTVTFGLIFILAQFPEPYPLFSRILILLSIFKIAFWGLMVLSILSILIWLGIHRVKLLKKPLF